MTRPQCAWCTPTDPDNPTPTTDGLCRYCAAQTANSPAAVPWQPVTVAALSRALHELENRLTTCETD